MATGNIMDGLLDSLEKADGKTALTLQECLDNQYGMRLPHYSLQYLFGSTGLRFGVFYSISGPYESSKTSLLLELCRINCFPKSKGGSEGISYYYNLEDKFSPTLAASIFREQPEIISGAKPPMKVVDGKTLEEAHEHITKGVLKVFKQANIRYIPLLLGLDSIAGASSDDVTSKLEKEGFVGKGFHDKSHVMKHFSENWSNLVKGLPAVFVAVNQEKPNVDTTMSSKKNIPGGLSQLYKAGHMISCSAWNMANGRGRHVVLKTIKTSFCEPRKLPVEISWNRQGAAEGDAQEITWNWAKATALMLSKPEDTVGVVGRLRDIIEVSTSDAGLVTCSTFGLRSVQPEEFEQALFENKEVLNALYRLHNITPLKTAEEFAKYVKELEKPVSKKKDEVKEPEVKAAKPEKKKKASKKDPKTVIEEAFSG